MESQPEPPERVVLITTEMHTWLKGKLNNPDLTHIFGARIIVQDRIPENGT